MKNIVNLDNGFLILLSDYKQRYEQFIFDSNYKNFYNSSQT